MFCLHLKNTRKHIHFSNHYNINDRKVLCSKFHLSSVGKYRGCIELAQP